MQFISWGTFKSVVRRRRRIFLYFSIVSFFLLLTLSYLFYKINVSVKKKKQEEKKYDEMPKKSHRESLIDWMMSPESGYIWPKEKDEKNDRIKNQLHFITLLKEDSNRLKKYKKKNKLIYHLHHSNYNPQFPEGRHMFKNCLVDSCTISRNRTIYRTANAVLIHGFSKHNLKEMLPKPEHQLWIVGGIECPLRNTHLQILETVALGNLVNWTMYYRSDSTISDPYGRFETLSHDNYSELQKNYAEGKRKMVAMLVSNCNGSNNGRLIYGRRLSESIDVDVYGRCGRLKCGSTVRCLKILKNDYKFYLAFENNNCRQYITEKHFKNALKYDNN